MEKKTTLENNLIYSLDQTLLDVIEILETDDGQTYEEKRDTVIEKLKQSGDSPLAERLLDRAIAEKQGARIKAEFWEKGNLIPAADGIVLRAVASCDKELYLILQEHYCLMKSMMEEESFREMLWKEHNEDKALMMTITKDEEYLGYCGIKDTTKNAWEIAIELLPERTGRGIGTVAITAMLNEIKTRLNVTSFCVKIDPDNTASQKLFERLGAIPNGLATIFLHKEEDLLRCEEDNLHLIDDRLTALANKFGVEPRKLLSHVLVYSLKWKERANGKL